MSLAASATSGPRARRCRAISRRTSASEKGATNGSTEADGVAWYASRSSITNNSYIERGVKVLDRLNSISSISRTCWGEKRNVGLISSNKLGAASGWLCRPLLTTQESCPVWLSVCVRVCGCGSRGGARWNSVCVVVWCQNSFSPLSLLFSPHLT